MRGHFGVLAAGAATVVLAAMLLTVGKAEATSTGQRHEARVFVTAGRVVAPSTGWQAVGPIPDVYGGADQADGPRFDPGAYPAGAAVRLVYVAGGERGRPGACLRLYDVTAGRTVPGTQQCIRVPADAPKVEQYATVETGPLQLAAGRHLYNMQQQPAEPYAKWIQVPRAELVITWTE